MKDLPVQRKSAQTISSATNQPRILLAIKLITYPDLNFLPAGKPAIMLMCLRKLFFKKIRRKK
jgi:hypothetical protein